MPLKKDYTDWSKEELIAHIQKLEKRKKYGLVWNEERTQEQFEAEAREYLATQPARGEFTLVVAGDLTEDRGRWTEDKTMIAIRVGLKLGESPSALAKRIANESGWARQEVYQAVDALKKHL